uniref:ERCC4 domain-containing protein n=1 Tax=Strigamia maritima TaxID=126957 RepID=T1J3G0_STRMM
MTKYVNTKDIMEIDLVSDSSDDSFIVPPMLKPPTSGGIKRTTTAKFQFSDDDNDNDPHDYMDNLNDAVLDLSSGSDEGNSNSQKWVAAVSQTADVASTIIPTRGRKLTQEEKERRLADIELKKQGRAQLLDERRRKQEAKEEEKRLKNEAKTQKQVEKERQKLLKKIETESNRNLKPDQSIKFIKVVIDSNLMQLPIGPVLVPLLGSAEIQFDVKKQLLPNSITWKRELVESSLSQELEIEIEKDEKEENEVLVYLPLEEFLSYVNAFKEYNRDRSTEKNTLLSRAKFIKNLFPNKKITFIVEGYARYSKSQKTSAQRKFRGAVLEATETATRNKNKKSNISVTDFDVEECIVAVLIEETCNVRLVDSSADVATIIISFTKSIAAAPYKQAKYNSQLLLQTTGDNYKGVKVKDSGEGLLLLWQKQIETFHNVSADVAQTIVNIYPSPSALIRAYRECICSKEKEKLLQDVMIRRGVGPLANTRRIGPELSRKIFLQMTSKNPDLNLHST